MVTRRIVVFGGDDDRFGGGDIYIRHFQASSF
jgi:hypothetical protein